MTDQKQGVFRRHPIASLVATLSLLMATLLFVVPCLGAVFCPVVLPFSHLGALQNDPMAEYVPPGTELVQTEAWPQSAFPASIAAVERTFDVANADAVDQAVNAITEAAKHHNWQLVEVDENHVRFSKDLGWPGVATLLIFHRDAELFGTSSERLVIDLGY